MPQYLFLNSARNMPRIAARAKNADRLFLFLDYDGTLTPLRKTPGRAIPSRRLLRLLIQLMSLDGTMLAIVTGRSLADIKSLVRTKGLLFAANHGFEIETEHGKWRHPRIGRLARTFSRIEALLQKRIGTIPGVLVQNKQGTMTIHYRNVAPSNVEEVRKIVEDCVHPFRKSVRITGGKKVMEVRPRVSWNKGHAIRWILKKLGSPHNAMIVCCGDDITDEDAFRLLPSSAVTIRVGHVRDSKARYYVRSVSEVHRFLRSLAGARLASALT